MSLEQVPCRYLKRALKENLFALCSPKMRKERVTSRRLKIRFLFLIQWGPASFSSHIFEAEINALEFNDSFYLFETKKKEKKEKVSFLNGGIQALKQRGLKKIYSNHRSPALFVATTMECSKIAEQSWELVHDLLTTIFFRMSFSLFSSPQLKGKK